NFMGGPPRPYDLLLSSCQVQQLCFRCNRASNHTLCRSKCIRPLLHLCRKSARYQVCGKPQPFAKAATCGRAARKLFLAKGTLAREYSWWESSPATKKIFKAALLLGPPALCSTRHCRPQVSTAMTFM